MGVGQGRMGGKWGQGGEGGGGEQTWEQAEAPLGVWGVDVILLEMSSKGPKVN